MGKAYRTVKDPKTGRPRRAHRLIAEEALGRPLLPGEVVHHRDGNHRDNHPDNLVVLGSQRHHASIEFHVRRTRQEMPSLFPEVLIGTVNERREGLFAHLCLPALPPLSRKK